MAATAVPVRSSRRGRRRQRSRVGDERLVARVRAGDHDAFETIYDRYYLGLLAFCRHMLGSRDEAEDALQQSFASAYRALRDGTGVVDLRPWLYAIARNRCLSALRAQRDEVTVDGVDLSSPFDGLPAEIARRAELRELVEDLQRLPDDQRAALVLFELGDQCHGQIAEVLGVRREKVKALVFQAREALLRARRAREASCTEIREQLASLTGDVPRRGILRGHIERCPGCAAFALEVRSQRAAFSAILPVAPTVGLKASVLALLGGGGAAAAGGAGVSAGVSAGGTTVGIASLGGKTVVAKALAVVALAGGAGHAQVDKHPAAEKAGPEVTQYAPARHTERPAVPTRATAARAAPTVVHHHGSKVAKGDSVKPAPTSAPAVQSPAAPKPAVQTQQPETATSPLQPAPKPAPPALVTPSATGPDSAATTAPPPPAPTTTAPTPQAAPTPTTESAPATTSTPATTTPSPAPVPAAPATTAAPAAATDTPQTTAAPLTTSATEAAPSAPAAATS